jgi:hypothetical protein
VGEGGAEVKGKSVLQPHAPIFNHCVSNLSECARSE